MTMIKNQVYVSKLTTRNDREPLYKRFESRVLPTAHGPWDTCT